MMLSSKIQNQSHKKQAVKWLFFKTEKSVQCHGGINSSNSDDEEHYKQVYIQTCSLAEHF